MNEMIKLKTITFIFFYRNWRDKYICSKRRLFRPDVHQIYHEKGHALAVK